jgi:transcriptional regulator with XRE-family HTH domain
MEYKGKLDTKRRITSTLARFGEDVRYRRRKLNLTQKEAAGRAGISQSHWSKIERGLHDPSIGQALRIQFALQAESLEGMLGHQPSALVLAEE